MVGEKEIGLLFLSPKLSRQEFSYNDLYLIQSLVSVASVSLLRWLADAHAIMERKQAEEAIIRAAGRMAGNLRFHDDMIAP